MEEVFSGLEKYDKVEVALNDMKNVIYKGQFRGFIKDVDNPVFDRNGSALWVTADQGFELMINMVDIYHFVITEKYKQ